MLAGLLSLLGALFWPFVMRNHFTQLPYQVLTFQFGFIFYALAALAQLYTLSRLPRPSHKSSHDFGKAAAPTQT